MPEHDLESAERPRQLIAVLYAFAVDLHGERRLVSQEQAPASTYFMLLPQLEAVPKRTLIDTDSGILIYDNYQDARYAATTVAKVAAQVVVREVALGTPETAAPAGSEGWSTASGAHYIPIAHGIQEVVKE